MDLGFPVASMTQVGIRTMNDEQFRQVERYGVEVIDMAAWHRGRRPSLHETTYVSIDMDAFDPAFAPGVSHREAAGLTPRDVIDSIQSLPGALLGADVVELNPSCDALDITSVLAAKVVKGARSLLLFTATCSNPASATFTGRGPA